MLSERSLPEVSLASRSMLCSLSICQWSARKHDPEASEETAVRHGASKRELQQSAASAAVLRRKPVSQCDARFLEL